MQRTNITEEDEGKRVVNAQGDEIGMVKGVSGNSLHVDPDPGLTDSIKSKLGWQDKDEEDYVLREDRIEHITDDEIRVT